MPAASFVVKGTGGGGALHQIKNAHTNNEVFAKIHERVQDKSSRRNLFYMGVLKFVSILLPPEVWERLKCRQKNCVHNLPVNKKNALRISRQTYNNQNSIKRGPGVGIWFLLTELRSLRGLETFLEFFTLTCLRGNGGMVSLSAASIFDPYFLLISFYFLWRIGPINCVMTTSGVSNVREKGKL